MEKACIFYGAGQNAYDHFDEWVSGGLNPVCFADADVQRHYTFFEKGNNLEILPLDEAIKRFPDYELHITIAFPNMLNAEQYLLSKGIPKENIKYAGGEITAGLTLREIHSIARRKNFFGKIVAEPILAKYAVLWDFSDNLAENATISSIEIFGGKMVAKLRQYPLKFHFTRNNWDMISGWSSNAVEFDYFTAKMVAMFQNKKCILDIGANIGFYSCLSAVTNHIAEIHAFEPIPRCFEILLSNLKLNGIDRVHANNIALSDISSQGTMYYSNFDDGSQSFAMTRDDGTKREISVTVETLDDYCEKNDVRPDFIKIDTEGAELKVLRGGEKTLRKYKPIICCEVVWFDAFGYTGQDVFDFVRSIGYRIYCLNNTELEEVIGNFQRGYTANYVFIAK